MSQRKAYVRVVETLNPGEGYPPIEIIAGVELHPNETVTSQYGVVRRCIRRAISPTLLHNYSDAQINAAVEHEIVHTVPNRSYFIEVGRGAMDEYTQVYVP